MDSSSLTVFSLDIPQQLGHSPFQNDHFDRGDAFCAQSTIYSVQHCLFCIRWNHDPPYPVWVCFRELLGFILGDKLPLSASIIWHLEL